MMIFVFYVIGGVIGILYNLRFLVPLAYDDLKNALGFFEALQTIGYHFVRFVMLSCICFFASWVSVALLYFFSGYIKGELPNVNYNRI